MNGSTLSLAVQLVSVVIWPVVLALFLLIHRKVLNRLLSALAVVAESANKIKVWQVEVERDIDQEVDKVAKAAQMDPATKPVIRPTEIIAATRVDTLIGKVRDSPSKDDILDSVRLRMLALAEMYDKLRENMPSSQERTVEMNKIAAQMRALGIAARPWLKQFTRDRSSAGVRLSAVAILQMSPNVRYLDWLGERFTSEHPFIFYQAAIALKEAIRKFGAKHNQKLLDVITSALNHVEAFEGGIPDRNSIFVLNAALKQLRSSVKETVISGATEKL